jgi:hypothetical protein
VVPTSKQQSNIFFFVERKKRKKRGENSWHNPKKKKKNFSSLGYRQEKEMEFQRRSKTDTHKIMNQQRDVAPRALNQLDGDGHSFTPDIYPSNAIF